MKKIVPLLLILTFILFSFTGCYDSDSIETFYYIVALGLDIGENSNLKLSIQIAMPDINSEASSQSTKQRIYSVECDTIDEGLNILDNYLSKKLNLSHCSTFIFSEELAKQGIGTQINTLANNSQIRPNSNLLISSKTAYDVMDKVSNSGENFSARYYEFIINATDYTGYSTISRFGDLFYNFNNDIIEATANYILVDDETIQSYGIAVFKDYKMVGTLSPLEAIAHSIVINEIENAIITIDDPFVPNSNMDINITLSNTTTNISIINNTPFIEIKPKIIGKIKSAPPNFDYSSLDNLEIIENSLTNYMNTLISNYLYKISRQYDSDICFLGEHFSTKCLTLDEFDRFHWNEIFKDATFNVNTNVTINSSYLFNKQ